MLKNDHEKNEFLAAFGFTVIFLFLFAILLGGAVKLGAYMNAKEDKKMSEWSQSIANNISAEKANVFQAFVHAEIKEGYEDASKWYRSKILSKIKKDTDYFNYKGEEIRSFEQFEDVFYNKTIDPEVFSPALKASLPYLIKEGEWRDAYYYLTTLSKKDEGYRWNSGKSEVRLKAMTDEVRNLISNTKGANNPFAYILKTDVAKGEIASLINDRKILTAYNKMVEYGYEYKDDLIIDGLKKLLDHFGCQVESKALEEITFNNNSYGHNYFWTTPIGTYPDISYNDSELIKLRKNIINGNKPILTNRCPINLYQ